MYLTYFWFLNRIYAKTNVYVRWKYLLNKGRGPHFSRRHQNAILGACDVASMTPDPVEIGLTPLTCPVRGVTMVLPSQRNT